MACRAWGSTRGKHGRDFGRPAVNRSLAALLICIPAWASILVGIEPGRVLAETPSEAALRKVLGESSPRPIPLWPDRPPMFVADALAEVAGEHARIRMVSVPTISVYLPPEGARTG